MVALPPLPFKRVPAAGVPVELLKGRRLPGRCGGHMRWPCACRCYCGGSRCGSAAPHSCLHVCQRLPAPSCGCLHA